MIALKIALAWPDRRVWCLDGDGAALMHLGALPIIAQAGPGNLIHAVIRNEAHETVGGMPVCDRGLRLSALAEAAGYRKVLRAEDEDSLGAALAEAKTGKGPILIEICCACGARADLGRPTTTPMENREALMKLLQKVHSSDHKM